MELLRAIRLIGILFVATCVFCWVFSSNWIFGPIVTVVGFFGGMLLISLLGVMLIEADQE